MIVYSVTETVDMLAGYSSIVVLDICLPPKHWSCPPPKLTILATCLVTEREHHCYHVYNRRATYFFDLIYLWGIIVACRTVVTFLLIVLVVSSLQFAGLNPHCNSISSDFIHASVFFRYHLSSCPPLLPSSPLTHRILPTSFRSSQSGHSRLDSLMWLSRPTRL